MLRQNSIRRFCSLSEPQIVHLLRSGDYHSAFRHFAKRPPHARSNDLYETAIRACAQVPDSVAAKALFKGMPDPTQTAAAHVISALCREREAQAAFRFLHALPSLGLSIDKRFISAVSRVAPSDHVLHSSLRALRAVRTRQPLASSAPFFIHEDENLAESPSKPHLTRRYAKQVADMEHALRAAIPNLKRVDKKWRLAQSKEPMRSDVAVLSAAISTFIACGRDGAEKAITVLVSWIRANLYDEEAGRAKQTYTANPSTMALLLTTSTKAIAAASPYVPDVCLSAYDALTAMKLPLFDSSLPYTGAYFKLLQHAGLSLEETQQRIERAKRRHIQLDEQAFSMALGAILRCDEHLSLKLAAGKAWMDVMRSACIPLTIHTYNLFAGQLRYCNNPDMVTTLLSDMTQTGLVPTAVTYGLIFSACVIPGDYRSGSRKHALPVNHWQQELEMMEKRMHKSSVGHTRNSRLSLARAYAHLGIKSRALAEFDEYLRSSQKAEAETVVSRMEVEDAYNQMIYNFAHCRECRPDGPQSAVHLFEQMEKNGFAPSGLILDSMLVAFVRMGDTQRAVECAKSFAVRGSMTLSHSGLTHLLQALAELHDAEAWWSVRSLCVDNAHLFTVPEVKQSVQQFVMSFARKQQRDVCDDMMSIAGIEISDLEYIFSRREFLRFRRQISRRVHQNQEGGTNAYSRNAISAEARPSEMTKSKAAPRCSRTIHVNSLVPAV